MAFSSVLINLSAPAPPGKAFREEDLTLLLRNYTFFFLFPSHNPPDCNRLTHLSANISFHCKEGRGDMHTTDKAERFTHLFLTASPRVSLSVLTQQGGNYVF